MHLKWKVPLLLLLLCLVITSAVIVAANGPTGFFDICHYRLLQTNQFLAIGFIAGRQD